MLIDRRTIVDVGHAALCVAFPWVVNFAGDRWAAVVVVLVVSLHAPAVRSSIHEPYRSAAIAVSALLAIGFCTGWLVALGWLVAAGCVGFAALGLAGRHVVVRPDALDLATGIGWVVVIVLRPELLGPARFGWAIPPLALLALRRALFFLVKPAPFGSRHLGPPDREVRGTLTLSGSIAGPDGLARTRPLEVEVLAGSTLAILGDDDVLTDLAEAVIGRRAPLDGQVCIDGVPYGPENSLVAIVAVGEPFVTGNLEDNLAVLRGRPLDAGISAAVREACALDEIDRDLGGGILSVDGSPLQRQHRLLVQTARVLASHFRIVVVIDPMPWVNPIRAEIWRQAVVRASVGRTAIWITGDRSLARRAERVVELRHGTLHGIEG